MAFMFKIDEVMSGTHNYQGKEQNFTFTLRWGGRVSEFFNPFSKKAATAESIGHIDIGGMGNRIPLDKGTLEVRYFSERKLRYTFSFTHEGKKYKFVGEKVNLWPWNLHKTHTTCYGKLVEVDSGKLVSDSVTHFRFKTIPAFVASFRFFCGNEVK